MSRRIRAPLLLQVSSYSVLFLSEVCRQSVGGADQSLVLLNTVTATSHGVSPVDSREFSGRTGLFGQCIGPSGFWSTYSTYMKTRVRGLALECLLDCSVQFGSILILCAALNKTRTGARTYTYMHTNAPAALWMFLPCLSVSCGWIRKRSVLWHGIMSGRCQIPQQ